MKIIINLIVVLMGMGFSSPTEVNVKQVPEDIIKEEVSFAAFLSHFPLREMPIRIGHAEMEDFNKDISDITLNLKTEIKDYNMIFEYLPKEGLYTFSRRGRTSKTYAIARSYISDNKVAVIYASVPRQMGKTKGVNNKKLSKTAGLQNRWADHTYQNLSFKMHVYDLEGNILPKKSMENEDQLPVELASRTIDYSYFGSVDADGNITKSKYKNEWKSDPYTTGLKGNEIVSFVKLDQDVVSLIQKETSSLLDHTEVISTP